MKALTEFLPEVLPHVPGCPQPVAVNAVRNAVIEFLADTGLLEQTVAVSLSPEEVEYSIDVDTGRVATTVVRAACNGQIVTPSSPAMLQGQNPLWHAERGMPRHVFIRSGMLVVVPIPVKAGELSVTFSCSYSRRTEKVDDFVLEDWIEAVSYGALSRLFALPGPFVNEQRAMVFRSLFVSEKDRAKVSRLTGSAEQSLHMLPRRFG